jgi:predicted nucleotidyltransferase
MTHEQKEELLKLIKVKGHFEITKEIRIELQGSVCRGEDKPQEDIEML